MTTDDKFTFTGAVERITFYSDESGYGVYKIRPDQKLPQYTSREGLITVVGVLPELGVGEDVEFSGTWTEDHRYGLQLRAEIARPIIPTERDGIVRFLSSGIVKGIGERRAEMIVDYFGDDTLKILNKNPERLTEVPQIKKELAERLARAWADNVEVRQTMIFLQGYGVSGKMANRIYDTLGQGTIDIVQNDPYALADEVHGIGFKRADQIARNMGLPLDSPQRLRAGLSYTLSQLTNEGHTYAPRSVLLASAREQLDYDGDPAILNDILNDELSQENLIADKIPFDGEIIEAIYLRTYHRAEVRARDLLRMMANMPSKITETGSDIHWQDYLAELAKHNNVQLTPQQQGAVQSAFTSKISVLTGGPGTGKTTTLQMVIAALDDHQFTYALVSPTGRAAKRLAEATNREAFTIHRRFGFVPSEGFMYDQSEPLDVDILIVDESSMIDIMLFASMLEGLRSECHLMLVGDVDQLPSVGAGNVLRDVINSQIGAVTRLDVVFRQEQDSHIITNAHRVNQGQLPFMDNQSKDFFFFVEDDPYASADLLVDVVMNRIPAKFGFDPLNDVQVISPMYRGATGIDNLNKMLQQALNPNAGRKAEKKIGSMVFRVGDKLMQTRNNYEKEVFNGDIGRLTSIDEANKSIEIAIGDQWIDYDFAETEELMHAYCISIHRSQGSEYPVVVLPLLTQHYMMLQRNLIYTAITRAKHLVIIVGSREAMKLAVKNNKVEKRYSGLLARLTL